MASARIPGNRGAALIDEGSFHPLLVGIVVAS